jgi:hypothetical protein
MLLNVLTSVVPDAGAFDGSERRAASFASRSGDRRLSDTGRARRLQLPGGGARMVACCAAFIWGCSSGKLDTFEVVPSSGGQAGTHSAGDTGRGGAGGSGTAGRSGGGGIGGEEGALLIDDFEDQDNAVDPDGWWYATGDGTGPTPQISVDAVTDRGDSRFALRVDAGPTSGYGSFLGLDPPGPFLDATGFSVLSFWARMEPPGELSVRFLNARGTHFQQVRGLDAVWREVRLPLADFVPVNEGDGAIALNELSHLQLWLPDTRPAYDLFIDDVWLLREP